MSEDDKQDKPKIIVDSDWKEQARKEKEELSKEADSKARPKQQAGEQPKPDFTTHCASLATQAMISMGAIAHPMTGEAAVDLPQARYVVDTLELLKEKTEGNLSEEEASTLDSLIGELKMVWAQVLQAVKEHQAKQAQGGEGTEA